MALKITTPVFRGSYANLFQAREFQNDGNPKFGVQALWDKTDPALKPIKAAIIAAAVEKFGEKARDILDKNTLKLRSPLRDGDEENPEDENYEGKIFANLNSKNKPGIVDLKGNPIFEESEAYSGCFFRATCGVYAYDNKSKGVSLGLNNVQLVKKGERLDGRKDAAEDFAEFVEGDEPKPAKGKKSAPKAQEEDTSDIE
jgi:hypothetical protein